MDSSSVEFVASKFIQWLNPTTSQRKKLKVRDQSVTPHTTFDRCMGLLRESEQEEIYDALKKQVVEFKTPKKSTELYECILSKVLPIKHERDPSKAYFNDSIKCPLSDLKVIFNVLVKKKSFLYDPINEVVHNYDFEFAMDRVTSILGKDAAAEWVATNSEDCIFGYIPYAEARIFFDDNGHKVFNTWTDAEWRKDWVADPAATLPTEVDAFLTHFLPDPVDRVAVEAWMHDATFHRAEPILVFCGPPGVGKNVFVNNLMGGLVGPHNRREATRNFANSAFHGNITNCRVFLLDEATVDPKLRETLKAYHNGTAAIERKGVDVGDPEPIHASFVLANNHWKHIKLEYTDRKFFTPKLGDVNLRAVWSQERVDNFVNLLTQDEYLQQIASYLKKTYTKDEARKFPKNAFFEQVCLNSLPQWFKHIHHLCRYKQTFNSDAFKKAYKHTQIVDPFILRDELDAYASSRGKPMAHLDISAEGKWTITSCIFEETNNTGGLV